MIIFKRFKIRNLADEHQHNKVEAQKAEPAHGTKDG